MHWLIDLRKLDEEIELLKWKRSSTTDDAAVDAIEKLLIEKEKHKQSLIDLVSVFKGLDQEILILKYIHGMKLEDVAEKLGYSTSHIRKRHASVIRTINTVNDSSMVK